MKPAAKVEPNQVRPQWDHACKVDVVSALEKVDIQPGTICLSTEGKLQKGEITYVDNGTTKNTKEELKKPVSYFEHLEHLLHPWAWLTWSRTKLLLACNFRYVKPVWIVSDSKLGGFYVQSDKTNLLQIKFNFWYEIRRYEGLGKDRSTESHMNGGNGPTDRHTERDVGRCREGGTDGRRNRQIDRPIDGQINRQIHW